MLPTTVIQVTPPPSAEALVRRARRAFLAGRTLGVAFRRQQLKGLLKCLEANEAAFCAAMHADLRKARQEAVCMELVFVVGELKGAIAGLAKWAKREAVGKSMAYALDAAYIYPQPYGVALVMGAWNYPVQLTLGPLVGAIAAGNCVVIKPSDLSLATSQLMYDLIPNYLDSECYPVYLGGIPETQTLLAQRFDYIFFTGAPLIGRIIHRAANEHLTPTTLELGGKSPAYIDGSADIPKAVRRLLWGKFANAGQTCIAPDYLLCTSGVQDRVVACARKVLKEFYGEDVQKSPDFGRIVNRRHFERLVRLLAGLKIAVGGRCDAQDLFIEPTIAIDVKTGDAVMQEEVFGPILPVIGVESEEEAIEFINGNEKPLALYVFTGRSAVREKFLARTSSGGATVNDTLMHVCPDSLPFGGVGNSGMGAYHGKASFDTFSHRRSVYVRNFSKIGELAQAVRYPPYSDHKTAIMALAVGMGGHLSLKYLPHFIAFVVGAVAMFVFMYFVL